MRCGFGLLDCLFLATALLSFAPPSAAHPHLWLVARSNFRVAAGRVVAVEVVLRFDELLSASLVADFDRDRDGSFDRAETDRLRSEVLDGLSTLDWLSHLRIDGRPAQLEPPSAFRAALEQGSVTFVFDRVLTESADPRAAPVALVLADPTWYANVVLDPQEPARILGEVPAGCALAFEPDTSLAGYAAPVPPIAVLLACERSS